MKQKICRAFLFFLFTFNVMAQDKWVLASTPFSFSKHYEKNTVSESLESAIPKLILEQFAENLTRTSFQDELIGRQLFSHRQKRLDLFLQLSGEVKNRDTLFLKNYSQKELNKKLKECEKKIDSLKKQIDENLLEDEVLVQKKNSVENANLENANVASEKSKGANVADEKNYVLEDVKLYKDSFTELFVSSADKNNLHAFEKSVVSNGINALLTGTISSYDGYISVAT
ncbi:MAG: hypothetical protein IKI31_00220, partial [Treponema sp.]|nr:hypothetical protein [Treponema sp.]